VLKFAAALAAMVVVRPITVNVWVLSLLVAKFPPALYTAVIVYGPTAVFPGSTNVALAAPLVTVPEVTGEPIVVAPCVTVKVTVPAFTVPCPLVTVAESVTFWLLALKFAVALAAVVVVAAPFTVSVWVLSLLVAKFPPAL